MNKLPDKWCIILDNKDIADYCTKNGAFPPYDVPTKGVIVYAHFPATCSGTTMGKVTPGYTLITFDDFKRLVLKIDNMQKYELTKETILKMAEESNEVKKSLKKAFPDVFKYEDNIVVAECKNYSENGTLLIEDRAYGEFQKIGFWLNNDFNWEIVEESSQYVLIPTKKQ